MSGDWFVQKLQREREAREAASQAVSFANLAHSQDLERVQQQLKSTRRELKEAKEALELERRRLLFVQADWVGAKKTIRELRKELETLCAGFSDTKIRSLTEAGGVFHKDQILCMWESFAEQATPEEMQQSIPPNLR